MQLYEPKHLRKLDSSKLDSLLYADQILSRFACNCSILLWLKRDIFAASHFAGKKTFYTLSMLHVDMWIL